MPRLSHDARKHLVEERQQQILQAAARVFAKRGFEAATIRDVARAAGVAEGSIYLYFKNKQDLLVHLPRLFIQAPVERMRAAALNADASGPSPEALLRLLAENIVNVITHNRELVLVLFTSMPTMDAETRATYMQEGPLYAMGMLETYLRDQQAAGMVRADLDPAIAARAFPGMLMLYLLTQEVLKPAGLQHVDYHALIPTIVSIFLRGVLNDQAPADKPTRQKSQAKPKAKSPRASHRKQNIPVE
jgi:TetR/AcrR family fatty acid metabolism transcriptional regulator